MPSFYIHDGSQALTLRIVGALTEGTAADLEQAWLTAQSTLADRELLVDLRDVVSVDEPGQSVLGRLAGQGARFISASRLTDSLAKKVSRRAPEVLPAEHSSIWRRLACALMSFCCGEKSSLSDGLPCGPSVRKLW